MPAQWVTPLCSIFYLELFAYIFTTQMYVNYNYIKLSILCAYVYVQVFTGYLISLDSIPVWLSWLQWLSIFRYAFAVSLYKAQMGRLLYFVIMQALTENELENRNFCAANFNDTWLVCSIKS